MFRIQEANVLRIRNTGSFLPSTVLVTDIGILDCTGKVLKTYGRYYSKTLNSVIVALAVFFTEEFLPLSTLFTYLKLVYYYVASVSSQSISQISKS